MTATEQYDAIVIGAGQSGGPIAGALGNAGWRTALIERAHVGGTCINYGCTPTKTMIASARVAHLARRGDDYGVQTGPIDVDLSVVRDRKRNIVEMFRGGSQSAIESTENLDLIFGEARFTGEKQIDVALKGGGSRQMTAETIIVNAGGRPRRLDLPGMDQVKIHSSETIMELGSVPEKLLVIGGGAVGLEFGQMFRRFGSQVTLLERSGRVATQEDAEIGDAIGEIFTEDGIDVLCNSSATGFAPAGGGKIEVSIESGDQERTITVNEVLMAVGRVPNTDWLDAQAAGLELDDQGYIAVNDRLETNVPGVYAIGDINGQPAFTHISYNDFLILRQNLLENGNASRAGRMLPYTIFIDPQLGRIGLNEQQARDQGYDVQVFQLPMSSVARALEVDETRGLMRAVVNKADDRILGASILGIEGGEIAGAIQIAMMGDLPYTAIRDGVFSHPTLIESLNNLFSSPVE